MGSITIVRSITGTVDEQAKNFSSNNVFPVSSASLQDVFVENAWRKVWEYNALLAQANNDLVFVMFNVGDEDALYRLLSAGPTYDYHTLPAGGHVVLHFNESGEYSREIPTQIALYSAAGTYIKFAVAY